MGAQVEILGPGGEEASIWNVQDPGDNQWNQIETIGVAADRYMWWSSREAHGVRVCVRVRVHVCMHVRACVRACIHAYARVCVARALVTWLWACPFY